MHQRGRKAHFWKVVCLFLIDTICIIEKQEGCLNQTMMTLEMLHMKHTIIQGRIDEMH
jgi:dethiobiotin synthetase